MITMMRQKQIFRQVEGIKMADLTVPDDELRPEYDKTSLKNGVRGKYAEQYAAGTNIVGLASDIPPVCPNEEPAWQGLIN